MLCGGSSPLQATPFTLFSFSIIKRKEVDEMKIQMLTLENKKANPIMLTCGIALFIMFAALSVSQLVYHKATVLVQLLLSIGFSLFLFGLYSFTTNTLLKQNRHIKHCLCVLGLLTLYGLQIWILGLMNQPNGWDVLSCLTSADELYYGYPDGWYLSIFPNNGLMILWDYLNIIIGYGLSIDDINTVLLHSTVFMVDMTFLVSYLVSKRFLCAKGRLVFISLSLLLFLFSPWLTVPYTDALGMFFPMLALFFYLKHREADTEWKRWLFAVLLALSGTIAYLFKTTAVIMIIAICLIHLFTSYQSFFKRVLTVLLTIAIIFACTSGFTQLMYALMQGEVTPETVDRDSFPATHYLMMGLSVQDEDYGRYCEEDVQLTASVEGKANKIKLNLEIYKERMAQMGFWGYLEFLAHKMAYTFNNGHFSFGYEGTFITETPYSSSDLGATLQQLYILDSPVRYLYDLIANAIWLIVLVLISISCLVKRSYWDNGIAVLRLCVLGLALFLMLFETRARYLFWCAPTFALLASMGAMALPSLKRKLLNCFARGRQDEK